MHESAGRRGTGPGVIAPDGCAVDLYAMLTPGREPDVIHAAAGGSGASILELGCGAGRVTHALTALGYRVVAVDESPEMLAHITAAETVCARIEGLALGRRFDVVLLASHLINARTEADRQALLRTCRNHVGPSGCVLIEQYAPGWFATAGDSEANHGEVTIRLRDVARPGPGLVSATVEYAAGGRVWTQSFTAASLGEDQLRQSLVDAGLSLGGYLTDDQSWIRAVAATVLRPANMHPVEEQVQHAGVTFHG
jgi:SAM-dependent methyltransferase